MHKDYARNYGALYGNETPCVPKLKKPRKKPTYEEDAEQTKLVGWLKKKGILFYHVPNGGKRGKFEAARLQRLGVMPGVPDICIPIGRKGSNSLYIELKRQKGGIVTAYQKYWLNALNGLNNRAVVCSGFEEAKKIVIDYLWPEIKD